MVKKNLKVKKGNNCSVENLQMIMSNLIINENIDTDIFLKDYKTIKEEFIKIKYPKSCLNLIVKKLNKIYQTYYVSIKEYLQELESCLNIYSVITKMSKAEYTRRIQEAFYNNIGNATKMQLNTLEQTNTLKTFITILQKQRKS